MVQTNMKGDHTMKTFDLFLSKYPPDRDLRKPTSEMLERFQGKVPAELLGF